MSDYTSSTTPLCIKCVRSVAYGQVFYLGAVGPYCGRCWNEMPQGSWPIADLQRRDAELSAFQARVEEQSRIINLEIPRLRQRHADDRAEIVRLEAENATERARARDANHIRERNAKLEAALREVRATEREESPSYDAAGRRLCRWCGDGIDHQRYGNVCLMVRIDALLDESEEAGRSRKEVQP